MRFYCSLLLAGLAGGVLGQEFEPTDFNVTEALVDLGVNVAAIPALDADGEWSSIMGGCSTAVS